MTLNGIFQTLPEAVLWRLGESSHHDCSLASEQAKNAKSLRATRNRAKYPRAKYRVKYRHSSLPPFRTYPLTTCSEFNQTRIYTSYTHSSFYHDLQE